MWRVLVSFKLWEMRKKSVQQEREKAAHYPSLSSSASPPTHWAHLHGCMHWQTHSHTQSYIWIHRSTLTLRPRAPFDKLSCSLGRYCSAAGCESNWLCEAKCHGALREDLHRKEGWWQPSHFWHCCHRNKYQCIKLKGLLWLKRQYFTENYISDVMFGAIYIQYGALLERSRL